MGTEKNLKSRMNKYIVSQAVKNKPEDIRDVVLWRGSLGLLIENQAVRLK